MADLWDIDIDAVRPRQARAVEQMKTLGLDLIILSSIPNIQYLTGARFAWTFEPFALLDPLGHCTLIGPEKRIPDHHAADEVATYEARWHSTMRNDQRLESTRVLLELLGRQKLPSRVGVEFSCFTRHFSLECQLIDIEPAFYRLRRRKDADELARLQKGIDATGRMYERAREIIRPGINELEVFNELHAVAVEHFGELPTGMGNDFQCGSRGGPPRDRPARAGELYILDLGPAFRGYFADNARTIAVSDPTAEQLSAWQCVVDVLQYVQETVRPGYSARDLFQEVQRMLDECPYGVFNHHLGHGIGLFPHEAPHLNPHWDETFEVGDVFTAEPGLYGPKLNAGMRIENDYLVTEGGIRGLTPFPLELHR